AARSTSLGVFVIGKLVGSVPPAANTDLSVDTIDSSDPITADNTLTYSITIRNNRSQTATNVGFKNYLAPDVDLVSFQSSQGTTQQRDGVIYGKLGTLSPGASATFTLVVKPTERFDTFP